MELIDNQPTQVETENIQEVTNVIEQYLDIINMRPDADQCWVAIQEICRRKAPKPPTT